VNLFDLNNFCLFRLTFFYSFFLFLLDFISFFLDRKIDTSSLIFLSILSILHENFSYFGS